MAWSDRASNLLVPSRPAYGFVEADLTGTVLYADIGYSRILGRPIEDIIGRNVLEFTDPADVASGREAITRNVTLGEPLSVRKSYVTPAGEPVAVVAQLGLLRDDDGRPVRTFGIMQRVGSGGFDGEPKPLPRTHLGPAAALLRLSSRARDMANEAVDLRASILAKLLRGAAREAADLEKRLRASSSDRT